MNINLVPEDVVERLRLAYECLVPDSTDLRAQLANRKTIEGLRKELIQAKEALEANRSNYLRYGNGFTFCSGCGERELNCGDDSEFPGAGNPIEIPHPENCPQRMLWDVGTVIDDALAIDRPAIDSELSPDDGTGSCVNCANPPHFGPCRRKS